MEPETRYTVIGAVVLALVGAAVFGYIWLSSSGRESDFRYYTIYFERQSLTGLQVGGNVNMRGITVGRVEDYSLSRDNSTRVKVDVRVARDTPVRQNTKAAVSRNILTGIAHINLDTPLAPAPELVVRPGERFPVIAEGTSNLDQITDSLTHLAQTANTSLTRANRLLDDDNQRIITELLINVRDLAAGLTARLGAIETATASIDQTALVFQQSARDLTRSAQRLLAETQPLPAKAIDTLEDMQVALREFARATRSLEGDIRQTLSRMEQKSSGVLQGVDDALDTSVLELRATALELRTSADIVARAIDQLQDPRALLLGPDEKQLGPGEQTP